MRSNFSLSFYSLVNPFFIFINLDKNIDGINIFNYE